jgi:SAM-dependent methyltransferase
MHEKRFNREIERLRDPDRVERMEATRVVDLALSGLADGISVVDVGIGSGLFAEEFARRGCVVTGVDVNPEMLVAAAEYLPGSVLKEGIAEKLPIEEASVDMVFMGLVLHETDDLQAALFETHRVGRCRLAVLEWPYEEGHQIGPPINHRIPPDELVAKSKSAGWTHLESHRLTSLILYILE